jgi:predicted MFS family arabinose efflux permease
MLMQSLTLFLYGLTTNVEVLFGIKTLESIAGAFFFTLSMTTVSDIAPSSRRGEAIGVFLTSFGFSLMLGPLFSSILISFLSYRQLFFAVTFFPMLGFIILIISKFKGKFRDVGSNQGRSKVDIRSISRILRSRNVLLTYLTFFTFSIPVSLFGILFPIYGTETWSFSPSTVSLLFTILGTTNALFRIPIGRIADRIERKIPLFLSQTLTALVFFMSSQVHSLFGLAIVFSIYGVAWGTNAVVGSTQIQTHTTSMDRGVASSLQGMIFDIGGIIGSFIAGAVVPALPINQIFKISVIMPVFGLLTVSMMRRSKKN